MNVEKISSGEGELPISWTNNKVLCFESYGTASLWSHIRYRTHVGLEYSMYSPYYITFKGVSRVAAGLRTFAFELPYAQAYVVTCIQTIRVLESEPALQPFEASLGHLCLVFFVLGCHTRDLDPNSSLNRSACLCETFLVLL